MTRETRQGTRRHDKAREGTRRYEKAREGTARHGKAREGTGTRAWGTRAQNTSYSVQTRDKSGHVRSQATV